MIVHGAKVKEWREEHALLTKVRIELPSGRWKIICIPDGAEDRKLVTVSLAVHELELEERADRERYARAEEMEL